MKELISFENISLQPITESILSLNEITGRFGLVLSEKDARELSETRNKAVSENERIEIGTGAVPAIVEKFCRSRYVNNENFTYVLNEVTYLFYYIKTETDDRISDSELIDELFKRFELQCRGSIDVLENREVGRIIRKINSGDKYFEWYKDRDELDYDSRTGARDTPENMLEDQFGREHFEHEENFADHDKYESDSLDVISSEADKIDYLDAFDEFLERESVLNKPEPERRDVARENVSDEEDTTNE
jgi:hypothetical protein